MMTKDNPLAWYLMPQFLKRLQEFSHEFTMSGSDNARPFFEECFGAGSPKMLGVSLCLDDKSEIIGHLLCGAEFYLGKPSGMVYQFSKDKGYDKAMHDTNMALQHIVQAWAKQLQITHVYALVNGKARAKLFSWFGFDDSMNMVKMTVGEVNYGRDVRQATGSTDGAGDTTVVGEPCQTNDEGLHKPVS